MNAGPDKNGIHEIEQTAAPQERMKTRWIVLLCAAAVLFAFVVVYVGRLLVIKGTGSTVEEKDFTLAGLTLTLTNEFETYANLENTAASTDINLTVFTENFSLLEGLENMSAEEYLALVRELNDCDATEIQTAANGVQYFTFTEGPDSMFDSDTRTVLYFIFVYKGADCFYTGQFAVELCYNTDRQLITDTDAFCRDFAAYAATARE